MHCTQRALRVMRGRYSLCKRFLVIIKLLFRHYHTSFRRCILERLFSFSTEIFPCFTRLTIEPIQNGKIKGSVSAMMMPIMICKGNPTLI